MAIGSSIGAFHEDEFRYEASQWFIDPKDLDDNVIDPNVPNAGEFSDNTERFTRDKNVVTPNSFDKSKKIQEDPYNVYDDQGNIVDYDFPDGNSFWLNKKSEGDINIQTVAMKDKMPFPNNKNPDLDFNNRFGDLPPSGILNDLKKPTGETVPLVRKIADNGPPYTMNPMIDNQNQAEGVITPGGGDPNFSSPQNAKIRLDQMLRDKAASRKAGDDVDGSDYMFYNTQIRALRDFLKAK